jgi:hypothetical protein
VQPDAVVAAAGTAPFGDLGPGGQRIAPAAFDRTLFCLSRSLRPQSCPNPPHLDALDHHPYAIRGPFQHARNADDVSVPDLGKLKRIFAAARRYHRMLPGGGKPLWVTEVSWDSNPPDPQGVPAATQAQWLAETFYVLWKQGVDTITWFKIRDDPKGAGYQFGNQSGTFLIDGTAKPSDASFRFPFVVVKSKTGAAVWAKAPGAGTVAIERLSGTTWTTVATRRTGASNIVSLNLGGTRSGTFRAQLGSMTSPSMKLGR